MRSSGSPTTATPGSSATRSSCSPWISSGPELAEAHPALGFFIPRAAKIAPRVVSRGAVRGEVILGWAFQAFPRGHCTDVGGQELPLCSLFEGPRQRPVLVLLTKTTYTLMMLLLLLLLIIIMIIIIMMIIMIIILILVHPCQFQSPSLRHVHGSFLIRRQRGHPGVALPLVISNSANH